MVKNCGNCLLCLGSACYAILVWWTTKKEVRLHITCAFNSAKSPRMHSKEPRHMAYWYKLGWWSNDISVLKTSNVRSYDDRPVGTPKHIRHRRTWKVSAVALSIKLASMFWQISVPYLIAKNVIKRLPHIPFYIRIFSLVYMAVCFWPKNERNQPFPKYYILHPVKIISGQ